MPELKAPDFLVDLYWDLRDRRLLPLVALVVVAMVAVPFLLGGGSKQAPPSAGAPLANALNARSAHASALTVVQERPGLRDYHKRLQGRRPTDPFVQRYTAPVLKGTKLGGGKEGSATSTSSTTVTKTTKTSSGTTTTSTETKGKGESTAGEEGTANPSLKLFSYAIDVKITRTETKADGSKQTSEPTVRHRVIPPAPLPSEKAQVVTFMGVNPKTRMPLLLISDAVSEVFGEGKCLSGVSTCQLIELEPGFPETFVYGANNVRYKINVLKFEPVVTGHS